MTRSDRTARALLLLLLAAAILLFAVSARPGLGAPPASAAASPAAAFAPLPSAEEEWEEDEDEGEWEVESDEEEWEVGEAGDPSEDGSGRESPGEGRRRAPEACLLYRVSARVLASDRSDAISLVVDYTLDKPAKVTVAYWLKGSEGALQMTPLRRRLSRQGSLQVIERLSDREMSKVRAARAFVVDLDMAGMPSYCERYCTRHLTARERRGGERTVWSEPQRETQGY